jgi:uncharacterized protein (DUF58 family)
MYSYIHQFRLLELSLKKVLSWYLLGNYKSIFHGSGLEFQEYRNREEGEDSSNIDWFISSREWKILVKKMQEERNLSVLQIVDSSCFFENIFMKEKKIILETVLFLTSLSALENADRVWVYLTHKDSQMYFPYSKKKSQLFQVYSFLQHIDLLKWKKQIFTFSQLRVKNNLIFYYTDSFEIDIGSLKILAFQNEIIVVHIFHSFENTLLNTKESQFLFSSFWWDTLAIDTISDKKRQEYTKLRVNKIENFKNNLSKIGIDYLLLDEKSDVGNECMKLMRRREKNTH